MEVANQSSISSLVLQSLSTIANESAPVQPDHFEKKLGKKCKLRQRAEGKLLCGQQKVAISTMDLACKELFELPEQVLECGSALTMLYLQHNALRVLPRDFFDTLCNLAWCDLRNNRLEMLPELSRPHHALRVLQLQENRVPVLPLSLGLHAVNLRTLGLRENPLRDPPLHVVDQGIKAIKTYLVNCYRKESRLNHGDEQLMDELDRSEKFGERYCVTRDPSFHESPPTFQSQDEPSLASALYRSLKRSSSSLGSAQSATVAVNDVTPRSKAVQNLRNKVANNLKYTNDVWRDAPFPGVSGRFLAAKSLEQMRQKILKNIAVQRDKLVQKIKDREALSKWRFETSELQKAGRKPGTCSIIQPPYGTFLNLGVPADQITMPSFRYVYLSPEEFEKEVSSCSKKLQDYASNPCSMGDTETALRRLNECEEIQRRLCSLKLKAIGL